MGGVVVGRVGVGGVGVGVVGVGRLGVGRLGVAGIEVELEWRGEKERSCRHYSNNKNPTLRMWGIKKTPVRNYIEVLVACCSSKDNTIHD